MFPKDPDFAVSRTIGRGQSSPADVQRLRRALSRTGHGQFPEPGAPNVTPGLIDAIRRFQTGFGLEPDAVIRPGGPTERALSIALEARNRDGEEAMEQVRNAFARRARAGLAFRPDPRRRNGGHWIDGSGRRLSEAQADAMSRPTRQLAMMRRQDQFRRPYRSMTEDGGRFVPPRGTTGAGQALRAITNQVLGTSRDEVSSGEGKESPEGMKRSVPLKNPDFSTPPSLSTPPIDLPDREGRPAEDRKPTVLVNPVPDERGIEVEIFPDLRDTLEQWLIVENSAGAVDGQQKAVDLLIEMYEDGLKSRKIPYDVIGGGAIPNEEKRRKELFLHRTKGVVKGGRRPDFSITSGHPEEQETTHSQVQDTWKDGDTPTRRERDAQKDIVELAVLYAKRQKNPALKGDVVGYPKFKYWDEAEWRAEMKRRVENHLTEKYGPPRKTPK